MSVFGDEGISENSFMSIFVVSRINMELNHHKVDGHGQNNFLKSKRVMQLVLI